MFIEAGLSVTTVEGIGNAKTRLHAVQQRMANSHGSQCGFCTPGIVMSMYTLLRNNPLPSMEEVEAYFQVFHNDIFTKNIKRAFLYLFLFF